MQIKHTNRYFLFLYLLSFLSGGVLMGVEMLGGKILGAVYGSSLWVWALVIGITMTGLSIGYFLGGIIADRRNSMNLLLLLFLINGCLILLMPLTEAFLIPLTFGMNMYWGVAVSGILLLLPPVSLMGVNSPFLIRLLAGNSAESGRFAGRVYGISTVSGVVFTLATGLFLLPAWGIQTSTLILALLIFMPAFLWLIMAGKYTHLWPVIAFSIIWGLILLPSKDTHQEGITLLDESEGLLGQVKILDFPLVVSQDTVDRRILLVNHIGQTVHNVSEGHSLWYYPHWVGTLGTYYPEGSEMLVIGAGGGSVVDEFTRLGHKADVVEIDARMYTLTKKYFYPDLEGNLFLDDGRHFLLTHEKKYDILVLDVFSGESIPFHLFTRESFRLMMSRLKPEGIIVVNFNGFWTGAEGASSRSLARTMLDAGLNLCILPTQGDELNRNLLFVGSPQEFPRFKSPLYPQNSCCVLYKVPSDILSGRRIYGNLPDLKGAEVLTDDKPRLDMMMTPVAVRWREEAIRVYQKNGGQP